MDKKLLDISNVSVTFKVRHGLKQLPIRAVQEVSMQLAECDTLAIIGESGSGKTTLTKAILGLCPITGGSIHFNGRELCNAKSGTSIALHEPQIQMVLQDPLSSFNPRYNMRRSLEMPMRVQGVSNKTQLRDHIDALTIRVGLKPEDLNKYPHQLSGGQLQRLSIARAISVSPRLIIADEPASKLDVSVRAQVLNLLKEVLQDSGAALMLISHDLDVARYLCQSIVVIRHGKLIETGDTEQIFASPQDPYTKMLIDTSWGVTN